MDYINCPQAQTQLLEIIQRRLTPEPVKISKQIDITCFSYKGIIGIQEALRAAKSYEGIRCNLVSSPRYLISITTVDYKQGHQTLTKALDAIISKITENEGNAKIVRDNEKTFEFNDEEREQYKFDDDEQGEKDKEDED